MVLQIGKAERARFIPLIKKTNIFECGKNGIVIEKEKGFITLYVTNSACSVIFARVPLGTARQLRGNVFVTIAYSEDMMLVDGGYIRIAVDYEQKIVSVNRPEITVKGSKHWGEDVQVEWDEDYDEFFNEPVGGVAP